MTSPARTIAHPASLDITIAARAGHAVQSYTQAHGQSARAAHAWIDTLHNRAQRAAERRRRTTLLR
ncbi:hypothetical protein [Mycolicibacterium tusciae]|uniref:hypothetical protein n=1 Tax=Mycolicibacterium tusciae TaxID=75922 RepID=UPI00024A470C|nr:hypothetical protein [Mycolicibacterium tusciae]